MIATIQQLDQRWVQYCQTRLIPAACEQYKVYRPIAQFEQTIQLRDAGNPQYQNCQMMMMFLLAFDEDDLVTVVTHAVTFDGSTTIPTFLEPF